MAKAKNDALDSAPTHAVPATEVMFEEDKKQAVIPGIAPLPPTPPHKPTKLEKARMRLQDAVLHFQVAESEVRQAELAVELAERAEERKR